MFFTKYRATFWIVWIFRHDSVDDSEAPVAEKCLDLQVVHINLNDLKVVNRTRCNDKQNVNCTKYLSYSEKPKHLLPRRWRIILQKFDSRPKRLSYPLARILRGATLSLEVTKKKIIPTNVWNRNGSYISFQG
jgi:hypothetical protein